MLLVDGTRLEWRTKSDSTLAAAIANAVQAVHIRDQADRLGISSDKLAQLLVPVSLTSRTLGAAHTADKDANTVGFIAVGLIPRDQLLRRVRAHWCRTGEGEPRRGSPARQDART